MRKYIYLILISISILLVVCSKSGARTHQYIVKPGRTQGISQQNNTPIFNEEQNKKSAKLSVWSPYDLDEETQKLIHEHLPDIVIEYQTIPSVELIQTYATAYKNNVLPDIIILDAAMMGSYNSIDAFVDLSQPPYNADTMISLYPKHLQTSLRSFDGKNLIALPIDQNPYVTFYRKDCMEAAGFPSEPEELAVYIENMNNWFNMAWSFNEKNQYLMTWSSEPIIITNYSTNLFDKHLNFVWNSDIYMKALDLGRTIDQFELASNANIMDTNNENTIQTGETVMFHSGIKYIDTLKKAAKGTAYGQWRITRLPFGLYGWALSSVAAIPYESDNKENAWKVLKLLSNRHLIQMSQIMSKNSTSNIYNDPLFGDQDIDMLYRTLINKMPEYNLTPLDEKAKSIWLKEWSKDRYDLSVPSGTLISRWSQTIMEQLDKDIKALKSSSSK